MCEDSIAAPPNTLIAEATVPVAMETLTTYCHLPRPWPPGRYRVDCFIGQQEESTGTVRFSIISNSDQVKTVQLSHQAVGQEQRTPFNGKISPDAGELFVVFETHFMCDVRENSYISWIAVDAPQVGPPNSELIRLDVPRGTYNSFNSNCSIKVPWPVGTYATQLVLDGILIKTVYFDCIAELEPRKIAAVLFNKGRAADAAMTPLKDDKISAGEAAHLYVLFKSQEIALVKREAKVTWIATACDEAPPNTTIASVDLPKGSYNEFKSDCDLPRAWPVGSYRVELWVDGKAIKAAPFMITK